MDGCKQILVLDEAAGLSRATAVASQAPHTDMLCRLLGLCSLTEMPGIGSGTLRWSCAAWRLFCHWMHWHDRLRWVQAMPKSLSHITSLRHLVDLRLTPTQRSAQPAAAVAAGAQGTQPRNEAEFCCPVTGTEMNGRSPFVVLQPSGLVVSERALKQVGLLQVA